MCAESRYYDYHRGVASIRCDGWYNKFHKLHCLTERSSPSITARVMVSQHCCCISCWQQHLY